MKAFRLLAGSLVVTSIAMTHAEGHTVVVPPTSYTTKPVQLSPAATSRLDIDSVFMVYQEGNGPESVKFQVVNINSGAIELRPQTLHLDGVAPVAAIVARDSVVITVRNDVARTGIFVVVNPLTGALKRGPVVFNRSGTLREHRLAVADTRTVVVAWQSASAPYIGRFTVIDPTAGTVKVPETPFSPKGINDFDVVAMDADHVAIVYQCSAAVCPITNGVPFFLTVRDPHSGALLRPPVQFGSGFGIHRVLKRNATDVLIDGHSATAGWFMTLNTLTGTASEPVNYVQDPASERISIALLNDRIVFIPYVRLGDLAHAFFVVHDVGGASLVSEHQFMGGAGADLQSISISTVGAGCRVFITYPDRKGPVPSDTGVFQILDFSDVCGPPPCPTEITSQVNVFQSRFVPFLFPFLQLQLVLVHNPSFEAIPGPVIYAVENPQNAALVSTMATRCLSPEPVQFVRFRAGPDGILSPNEIAGGFLLFVQTSANPIAYTPRLLGGTPPQ